MRLVFVAALSGLLTASCRPDPPARREVCDVLTLELPGSPAAPRAPEVLARHHGLTAVAGLGSTGVHPLLVEGSIDDAFLARECLRSHDHARGVRIATWPAGGMLSYPEWDAHARSDRFRVASVPHAHARRVVADLEDAGIPVEVSFGDQTDFVLVPRSDALPAWSLLRADPRPGLVAHHPDFEGLPSPLDALQPIAEDDPEAISALATYRRFPEPAWPPFRWASISDGLSCGRKPTLDERDFVEHFDLWLRARAYVRRAK
jgi:hypothetical protein